MNAPSRTPLDRDAMRLIAEIGFIGTQMHELAPARAIFEALTVLRPDSTLPCIGRALAELSDERPAEAVRILRDEALKLHPSDPEVMAFLGLALKTAGRDDEAREVLDKLMAQEGQDAAAPYVRLAEKLLEGTPRSPVSPVSLMPRMSGY